MVIHLTPELEAALQAEARQKGVSPEDVALGVLRERLLGTGAPIVPQDEWERRLLSVASDCGVSLSHAAVSSEGIYE